MKNYKKIYILVLTFCLTSCIMHSMRSKKYWNIEKKKMETCRKEWKYVDLTKKTELKVLLFRKKYNYDRLSFPNFIIGITTDSDTIGIIDKDFDGTIKKNEKITVLPTIWTETEKELIKPVFAVYKNTKDNDLHCSVKIVYYGLIEKK